MQYVPMCYPPQWQHRSLGRLLDQVGEQASHLCSLRLGLERPYRLWTKSSIICDKSTLTVEGPVSHFLLPHLYSLGGYQILFVQRI
jgi:hypothetical protein